MVPAGLLGVDDGVDDISMSSSSVCNPVTDKVVIQADDDLVSLSVNGFASAGLCSRDWSAKYSKVSRSLLY